MEIQGLYQKSINYFYSLDYEESLRIIDMIIDKNEVEQRKQVESKAVKLQP